MFLVLNFEMLHLEGVLLALPHAGFLSIEKGQQWMWVELVLWSHCYDRLLTFVVVLHLSQIVSSICLC